MTKSADSEVKGTQDAKSEGSDKTSNQMGSSQSDTVSVEQFNQLQAQIENLRRGMQSDKDRAVKQVAEKVSGLETDMKTLLQSAARSGKSASDVLDELREAEDREARETILEFSRALRSGRVPAQSQGSEEGTGVNVAEVVKDLELDENDVSVRAFMSKTFKEPKEAYREAAKLAKSLSRQPSDADAPSHESKRSAPAGRQKELEQEYIEGSKNLYGRALIQYKQKMREKGLDIH